MSKNLTVSEVLAWKPETLSAQAAEWTRQVGELRTRMDAQYRAVENSRDTWKGKSGDAMRDRFTKVRTKWLQVIEALEKGSTTATLAQASFVSAKAKVQSSKSTAESKLLQVDADGTCTITEQVKQRIYSAVNGDSDRYSTAISALIVDADAQTAAMKQALEYAAQVDTHTKQGIEAAFANFPTAESFGNGSPTVTITKEPPKNGTPEDNKNYWESLTAAEKEEILRTQPSSVGSLDGVPADVRDKANRAVLDTEQARLEREVKALNARVADSPDDSRALQERNEKQRRLDDVNKISEVVKDADRKPQPKLLALDVNSGRQVRAAIAVGDPDNADHISVATPGLGTTADSLGGMVNEAQTLKTETERQLDKAGRSTESVATVAWLGYDPPQKNAADIVNVGLEGRANEAAKPLAQFYEGLETASNKNDPHITALGHSYGSLATSQALQENGKAVDDVVFYGSPGLGGDIPVPTSVGPGWQATGLNDEVESAQDLGLKPGHVYAMNEHDDPAGHLNSFGRSPTHMPWVTELSTEEITDGQYKFPQGSGHASYPRTPDGDNPNSPLHRSGYNLAAVVAGLPGNATNPSSQR
ncbi:alpha/beta hydrolase [Nocardia sp. NPDC050712]|uniref:alpha/beta hydrolase n=1 Tax=Nocardia sp. NPDC050712 TaxID=3155518 RepID=UPI0033D76C0E